MLAPIELSPVEQLTGATPLVRLPELSRRTGSDVYGKCEFLNPNGSLKDRIALAMIKAAEESGQIERRRSTLVEATGGNTGIALASLAIARGYRLIVTMSSKMSREKVDRVRAWGAEVVICPADVTPDSPEHFINVARRLGRQPDHFCLDQFTNSANVAAHLATTGPEIWSQAAGNVGIIVAGAGTGGTLTGIATYARMRGGATKIALADPYGSVIAAAVHAKTAVSSPYAIEGIGGDFVPPLLNLRLIDHAITVSDDESIEACHWMQKHEGLCLGGSSGCVVAAFIEYVARCGRPTGTAVLILADDGRNYLRKIYGREASTGDTASYENEEET